MIGIELLRRISGILNKSLSASDQTVYTAVFDILDEVMEYESATLFVADPESHVLSIALSRGPVKVDLVSDVRFDHGKGLSGWTGSRKEPVIISSLGKNNSARGFCSMASIPLWLDKRLIGVLNLGHSTAGFFTEAMREGFIEVGLQLTLIVEQLHLRSMLREQNMKLKEVVTELQETQASLVEKERLAAIGELVVKVNHEINNPLAAIIGMTDLILLNKKGESKETKETIEKIREAAYRIHAVTEALMKIESSAHEEYVEGVKMLKID